MTVFRKIQHIYTVPPLSAGFGGKGHTAAAVIPPEDFPRTDPFFLMMDDNLSIAGPFGEPHPHAGLETVTFMLNGTMITPQGRADEGDIEWMTAGTGIVHGKDGIVSKGMRLLQLWVALPESGRKHIAGVKFLRRDEMPVRQLPGATVRVYSGASGDTEASTENAVPMTLLDIRMEPGTTFVQDLPSSYNGFLFLLEGELSAGSPATGLSAGQVGWLDRPASVGESTLALASGGNGPARALFYAGEPLGTPLAARGPFLAESESVLAERFAAYRRGEFPWVAAL